MTKQQQAEKYCYDYQLTHDTEAERTFIDGYEAAEADMSEMMCKFAEWVDESHLYLENEKGEGVWLLDGDANSEQLTTKELLNIFTQQNK